MNTRRQVLAGVSGCLAAGGLFAATGYGSGGESSSMGTDEHGGCQSGVEERPANGTFKFVGTARFDEVWATLEVDEGEHFDEVRISSSGTILHTETDVGAGRQKILFSPGDATMFTITAVADGTTRDTAKFYATCDT
ncbi:hypothetical protein [Haloarchaeobius sp. DFWS5]|uniref:hypothetical protein n=1 Tax=Haloarchaeobius sp. DFWS5 TaxID=3446114 RepID=UPI003EBAF91E